MKIPKTPNRKQEAKKLKPCKLCEGKRWGNTSWCFRHYREREILKREESQAKRLARKLGSKKYQESELKKWKAKTWTLMSEWIRRKDADFQGYSDCFTCKAVKPWKELQGGHFIHGKLDYDPRNIKRQCSLCNVFYNGRRAEFALRLVKENGLEWVEQLQRDAAQEPKPTLDQIKSKYEELKGKLEGLDKNT